jgi:2-polyprenyl-6-methoxyphenol hydroxylase-like FAD-dependent oxidoreductase
MPRYAGFNAWRAVLPFDHARLVPGVSWGCGQRFGVMPLAGGRLNWFAAINGPPASLETPANWKADLLAAFQPWHAPIAEIIEATQDQDLLLNAVYDRPRVPRWSVGRVSILGDAAHPMTPSIGQGACQAIEDAVVLARCLRYATDAARGLQLYEGQRRPRTHAVARQSRRIDRIAQLDRPVLCALRDTLVRRLPTRFHSRQLDWITSHRL